MAKIRIGTMRCPQRAVVTQTEGETKEKLFTIDSTKRCEGVGPVYSDPDRDRILTMECPEGKKDEERWAKVKGDPGGREKLLANKPTHQTELVEMRKDIWASQVRK